jgi:hypothetical protein
VKLLKELKAFIAKDPDLNHFMTSKVVWEVPKNDARCVDSCPVCLDFM